MTLWESFADESYAVNEELVIVRLEVNARSNMAFRRYTLLEYIIAPL